MKELLSYKLQATSYECRRPSSPDGSLVARSSLVALLLLFVAGWGLVSCSDEDTVLQSVESPSEPSAVVIPDEAAEGELLIKFAPELSDVLDAALKTRSLGGVATRSGIPSTDEVLETLGAYDFERIFPVDERTEARTREAGLHLWYLVRFDEDTDLREAYTRLTALGEVSKVQCNRTVQPTYKRRSGKLRAISNELQAPSTPPEGELMATSAFSVPSLLGRVREGLSSPFDDPGLPLQWGYINRGGYSFAKEWAPVVAGADVGCEEAWELCTGDPSIIVAVFDEGVMWDHPDLQANMWVNEAEELGSDTDADGNGYAGDKYGYNFATNSSIISWNDAGDTGHGTHVAGTIAAVNGNGEGVCGIAGGNHSAGEKGVKIMVCQIFADGYSTTLAQEAKAMKYAADNGAVIIQCSWGYNSAYSNIMMGYTPGPGSEKEWEELYPLEKESLDYFIRNAGSPNGVIEGGLAIFAAGNEYAAMPAYPGAYSRCLSVSAIAADFTPSTYTDYGEEVDFSAPGGDSDYYGTVGDDTDEGGMIYSTMVVNGQPGYGYYEGSSMACPHVVGVAALGLSYAAKLRRHFKVEEYIELMRNTSTYLDDYFTGVKRYNYFHSSPGSPVTLMELSDYRGRMGGLVNAGALLRAVAGSGSEMRVPNVYVSPGASSSIDLARYFLDGENLSYSCTVDNASVATATVEGTLLTVSGLSIGSTSATVKTSSGTTQTIVITVRRNAGESGWM